MGEEKNIVYSAADIERYHKKLMSAKEMHALEKAALEDPFLADALEGYAVVPDVENDIILLREKLNERVYTEGKVIPIKGSGFPWLRIAALFIVIAGAALLAYQFIFTNNDTAVAKSEPTKQNDTAIPQANDTNTTVKIIEEKTSSAQQDKNAPASVSADEAIVNQKNKPGSNATALTRDTSFSNGLTSDESLNNNAVKKADDYYPKNEKQQEQEIAAQKQTNPPGEIASGKRAEENASAKKRTVQAQAEYKTLPINNNNQANIFRGQVLDANNTPLPFANVTNTKDNVGTYTDVKGYFTLISPDSALNVQVRSVGFENANSQLQNNVSSNAIVLQQDLKNIPSTTVSKRKTNTERVRQSNMVLEEPEPYDGWYNYDTYIANNINLPDDVKQKNTSRGEVELSFDISKSGEPVNIKVEKSVCKECDEEAIRLLKEGPKWKKKKKNRRARLNVAF